MLKKISGNKGEALAYNYLQNKGYKILQTNFLCKLGEIDIIAENKGTLVFVEVKYRVNNKFSNPIEAITPYKIHNLRNTANYYLLKNTNFYNEYRFDIISITNDEITHIENAF